MEEMQLAIAMVMYEAWRRTSGGPVKVTGFILGPDDTIRELCT